MNWQPDFSSLGGEPSAFDPWRDLKTSVERHPVYEGLTPLRWADKHARRIMLPLDRIQENGRPYPEYGGSPDSGLYFLFSQGVLLYIGQSNCISYRLKAHRKSGKLFDATAEICLPELVLDLFESAYLHWLKPPLNERFNPHPEGIELACRAQSGDLFKS